MEEPIKYKGLNYYLKGFETHVYGTSCYSHCRGKYKSCIFFQVLHIQLYADGLKLDFIAPEFLLKKKLKTVRLKVCLIGLKVLVQEQTFSGHFQNQ